MSIRIQRSVLPVALVVALVAAACGGGDEAATAESTPTPTAASTPAGDPTTTPAPTLEPTEEPTPTPEPTDEPTPEPTEAPPEVSDYDAAALEATLPQLPEIAELPEVEAAADPDRHLQNMFDRVVGTLAGSPLSDAAATGAVTENWMPELVPDLVLQLFAIDATVTANVMADIQAYAEAGAGAGYGEEPTRYFADRAVAARNLRDGNVLVVETLAAIADLDIDGRRCAAAALEDGPDECDEGEAADLLAPVFDISLSDLELPDDADDDIADEALCAAWDSAVERLRLDDETLGPLELAVDDSITDTRFLNRSECRYLADLGEDVEPDRQPALDALGAAYSGAIDTALTAGGVPDEGDVPLEYDPALLELEAASLWSAAEAAALAYRQVDEATARLYLMILVDVGASSAELDARLAEIDRQVVELGPDALECWFEASFEDITTCEPALEPLLADADALYEAFLDEHDFGSIDWGGFDDVYGDDARCDVWSDTARSRPDTDLAVVDRAVEYLATFAVDLEVRRCDSLE